MLVNDVSLRNLIELAKAGFFQSKAASAFSPVCVTPERAQQPPGGTKLLPIVALSGRGVQQTNARRDIFNRPTGRACGTATRLKPLAPSWVGHGIEQTGQPVSV
jgi:fumarylacetoacetate (FAA) hydrolase